VHATQDHWRWRLRMAEKIAPRRRLRRQGCTCSGSEERQRGPSSDIDLSSFGGTERQPRNSLWLEGWGRSWR
jgi:hypothetical protein